MNDVLTTTSKKQITFEIIFMTYSYIHDKINTEAFPKSPKLYSKDLMTSRGVGKYHYKDTVKNKASIFIQDLLKKNFTNYNIKYIV
jgi:spore photoproduct lyase